MKRNDAFIEQWRAMQADLRALKTQVNRVSLVERAEVAGGVPVYATTGDLPAAGKLGRLAAVQADGGFYFDDGTGWKQVTLT